MFYKKEKPVLKHFFYKSLFYGGYKIFLIFLLTTRTYVGLYCFWYPSLPPHLFIIMRIKHSMKTQIDIRKEEHTHNYIYIYMGKNHF